MSEIDYILKILIAEQAEYWSIKVPSDIEGKSKLIRSLMNLRQPLPLSDEFIRKQDIILKRELEAKGIKDAGDIPFCVSDSRLKLWQGDITLLKIDAIVNAANSTMLGCFIPLHSCIDNAIHSAAGVQLRQECFKIMQKQGHPEPTGCSKITKGYNLPSKYIIHTVGPVIADKKVTKKNEMELAQCYESCLTLANDYKLESIAFCCISTGEFKFPNQLAAEIAVDTVTCFLNNYPDTFLRSVVFNVFKDYDFSIYSQLLQ